MRKRRVRPYRRNVRTFTILVFSFVIIAGCSETISLNPESKSSGQEQALKSVKVSKITKQKIGEPVERAAEVQSSVQLHIVSKAGGDIEQILKTRGDVVQEGEVIVKLTSADAKAQSNAAALAVIKAQDAIKRAKEKATKDMQNRKLELNNSLQRMEQTLTDITRNYNKTKNDYEIGLASKVQVYQAEVQLRNVQMDLEQLRLKQTTLESADSVNDSELQLKNAQFMLQQVEQSILNLDVKSPISGLLTEMPIESWMSPLQQGREIGVIQKLDPIKIKAQLTEEDTKLVSGKTELTYYVPGTTQKFKGKVSFLSKVMNPETKAYEINLDVPNPEMNLKPGMKLWLQLTDEQEQIVVTIPTYSIVKQGDDTFAFILNGDQVEKRKVQLGRVNEPNQEVLSGIKEGEEVVVSKQNQLKDKENVLRENVQVNKTKME